MSFILNAFASAPTVSPIALIPAERKQIAEKAFKIRAEPAGLRVSKFVELLVSACCQCMIVLPEYNDTFFNQNEMLPEFYSHIPALRVFFTVHFFTSLLVCLCVSSRHSTITVVYCSSVETC